MCSLLFWFRKLFSRAIWNGLQSTWDACREGVDVFQVHWVGGDFKKDKRLSKRRDFAAKIQTQWSNSDSAHAHFRYITVHHKQQHNSTHLLLLSLSLLLRRWGATGPQLPLIFRYALIMLCFRPRRTCINHFSNLFPHCYHFSFLCHFQIAFPLFCCFHQPLVTFVKTHETMRQGREVFIFLPW